MAQQTINIGAAPDDNTGDPARTAFGKCNDNFTELYTGKVNDTGDTMTGPLVLPVGSTAATSINFGGVNTGFYGIGTTNLAFAVSGVNKVTIATASITAAVPFRAQAGTVAAPAYSFTLDTACGIYRSAALALSMAINGVENTRWEATGIVLRPAASATPANNGDMMFELTSNTSLTIKAKGSDGVVRSVALTLA